MDMASLPRAVELASPGARNPRWHPGGQAALHSEIFAPAGEASGAGAALALALDGLRARGNDADAGASAEERSILWVQDKAARRLGGRPYRPGLPENLRHRLIHVAAKTPEDALFALEEGVRCRDLACVIGEVAGNPRALTFTASRRLSLTAERHGVPLFLVRLDAETDLSSARMRWQMRAAPSAPPLWNPAAPGHPAWQAQLFRARSHAPGEWILRDGKSFLAAERLADGHDTHGEQPEEKVGNMALVGGNG
ncbi:recA-like protein [Erythrobacter alti]|uniref:recA-like protein n=1 Tax=Erythrobacter alti TaxID=1896145 RepID=UPI0030F4A00D